MENLNIFWFIFRFIKILVRSFFSPILYYSLSPIKDSGFLRFFIKTECKFLTKKPKNKLQP